MNRRLSIVCRCVLLLSSFLAALPTPTVVEAAEFPAGFEDTVVMAVPSPTGLAFTPDGRLLVTTQAGLLRVYRQGALLPDPALDLRARTCANSERGLLGIAVDPDFTVRRAIYLYYTFNKFGTCEAKTARVPVNRVSRFTLTDVDRIDPASEVILVDNMPSYAGNHNAGDLKFGKDGYLYISVGDGGCDYLLNYGCARFNDAARDQHHLLGKILRITTTGQIPPTNPFQGADTARCNVSGSAAPGQKCQETFAWGLRNPFRMAFDPNAATTRFFINDVGQARREEINLGQAGADYGWNVREGSCLTGSLSDCGPPPAGMTNPIFDYRHDEANCSSITGGAFVPDGVWPSAYDGAYLFSDYACGKIATLSAVAGGGYIARDFVTSLGVNSAVTLLFGPYGGGQALFYTNYRDGGQVRRVAFTGSENRTPVVVADADPTAGALPLIVNFDASQSSDPDHDPLAFEWDFGDGSPPAVGVATSHVYGSAGRYDASVTVRDPRGAVASLIIPIFAGNTPPVPMMTFPSTTTRFRVGARLTLQGSATDQQDGALPATSLEWVVIQHHGSHAHPFIQPTHGNNIPLTAPAPEDMEALLNSMLEVQLTATDSQGLSSTITRFLRPKLVDVTFGTDPAGLQLRVNGSAFNAQTTLTSWEGYRLNAAAPTQWSPADTWVGLERWSDGNTRASRAITTPSVATTYSAFYRALSGPGLKGLYYNNPDLTNRVLARTDPVINFDWGSAAPSSVMDADSFSARWNGRLDPRFSEPYTFYVSADDGVRLWVNNQLVIDSWSTVGPRELTGAITLTAGQKVNIQLIYKEVSEVAFVKLEWSSARQVREVIPQSRLFPSR